MRSDQEMRGLIDEATEGPWDYETIPETGESRVIRYFEFFGDQEEVVVPGGTELPDAAFITAAREWVPDALQRLEEVREFAHLQARPFPDGVPDREGQAIAADLLKILDGRSK